MYGHVEEHCKLKATFSPDEGEGNCSHACKKNLNIKGNLVRLNCLQYLYLETHDIKNEITISVQMCAR